SVSAWSGKPGCCQLLGVRIRQRLQEDSFEHTEDHGVGPHARRKRDQAYDCEHRRARQPSCHQPQLICWGIHKLRLPGLKRLGVTKLSDLASLKSRLGWASNCSYVDTTHEVPKNRCYSGIQS